MAELGRVVDKGVSRFIVDLDEDLWSVVETFLSFQNLWTLLHVCKALHVRGLASIDRLLARGYRPRSARKRVAFPFWYPLRLLSSPPGRDPGVATKRGVLCEADPCILTPDSDRRLRARCKTYGDFFRELQVLCDESGRPRLESEETKGLVPEKVRTDVTVYNFATAQPLFPLERCRKVLSDNLYMAMKWFSRRGGGRQVMVQRAVCFLLLAVEKDSVYQGLIKARYACLFLDMLEKNLVLAAVSPACRVHSFLPPPPRRQTGPPQSSLLATHNTSLQGSFFILSGGSPPAAVPQWPARPCACFCIRGRECHRSPFRAMISLLLKWRQQNKARTSFDEVLQMRSREWLGLRGADGELAANMLHDRLRTSFDQYLRVIRLLDRGSQDTFFTLQPSPDLEIRKSLGFLGPEWGISVAKLLYLQKESAQFTRHGFDYALESRHSSEPRCLRFNFSSFSSGSDSPSHKVLRSICVRDLGTIVLDLRASVDASYNSLFLGQKFCTELFQARLPTSHLVFFAEALFSNGRALASRNPQLWDPLHERLPPRPEAQDLQNDQIVLEHVLVRMTTIFDTLYAPTAGGNAASGRAGASGHHPRVAVRVIRVPARTFHHWAATEEKLVLYTTPLYYFSAQLFTKLIAQLQTNLTNQFQNLRGPSAEQVRASPDKILPAVAEYLSARRAGASEPRQPFDELADFFFRHLAARAETYRCAAPSYKDDDGEGPGTANPAFLEVYFQAATDAARHIANFISRPVAREEDGRPRNFVKDDMYPNPFKIRSSSSKRKKKRLGLFTPQAMAATVPRQRTAAQSSPQLGHDPPPQRRPRQLLPHEKVWAINRVHAAKDFFYAHPSAKGLFAGVRDCLFKDTDLCQLSSVQPQIVNFYLWFLHADGHDERQLFDRASGGYFKSFFREFVDYFLRVLPDFRVTLANQEEARKSTTLLCSVWQTWFDAYTRTAFF